MWGEGVDLYKVWIMKDVSQFSVYFEVGVPELQIKPSRLINY